MENQDEEIQQLKDQLFLKQLSDDAYFRYLLLTELRELNANLSKDKSPSVEEEKEEVKEKIKAEIKAKPKPFKNVEPPEMDDDEDDLDEDDDEDLDNDEDEQQKEIARKISELDKQLKEKKKK